MEDKQASGRTQRRRRLDARTFAASALAVGLCLSLGANAAQAARALRLDTIYELQGVQA